MLSPAKVEEVRRLLARSISQRQIARELQISRGTVGAIALNRRPDYPAKLVEDDDFRNLLPPARCPGCGGMVHGPCRLCRVRAIKARTLALAKARRRDFLRAAG